MATGAEDPEALVGLRPFVMERPRLLSGAGVVHFVEEEADDDVDGTEELEEEKYALLVQRRLGRETKTRKRLGREMKTRPSQPAK